MSVDIHTRTPSGRADQRGAILITTIALMMTLGMMTLVLFEKSETVSGRTTAHGEEVRLRAIGDAATDLAMHHLWLRYKTFLGAQDTSLVSFRTFMDAGEYGFGVFASPLAAGLDCPANAVYFDALMPLLGDGKPVPYEKVICLFERNAGNPAWRHHEVLNQTHESRAQVDLVLRMIAQIGNYDYILDWVFTQAGEIRVDLGATGINITKAVHSRAMSHPMAAADTAHGALVAPHLVSPVHDHFFSFRLDLDVDGPTNSVVRGAVTTKTLPAASPRRSI